MAGSLDIVKQYFAGQDRNLEKLFDESDSFQSLCEDFQDCLKAREYWCGNVAGHSRDDALCAEYRALCEELKDDIMTYITDNKTCDAISIDE